MQEIDAVVSNIDTITKQGCGPFRWFWGLAADLQELGKNVLPERASGGPSTRAHLPTRELIRRAPADDKAAADCLHRTLALVLHKTSRPCNFVEAVQTAVPPETLNPKHYSQNTEP